MAEKIPAIRLHFLMKHREDLKNRDMRLTVMKNMLAMEMDKEERFQLLLHYHKELEGKMEVFLYFFIIIKRLFFILYDMLPD